MTREEVIEEMTAFKELLIRDCRPHQNTDLCEVEFLFGFKFIEAINTLIAEFPKKGKWIERDVSGFISCGFNYECSNCGCVARVDETEEFNYCPICGADMRGESDERMD